MRRPKLQNFIIFGLGVGLLSGFATVIPAQAASLEGRAECWAPAELSSKAGEKVIQHAPYNPEIEPKGHAEDLPKLENQARGSIRRVELPGNEKLIALTFDLCENGNEISGYDGQVVDTLRKFDTKATFFASGKWLIDHRERAEQLLADPLFEIGAHSWTHRNYRVLNESAVNSDLDLDLKADEDLRKQLSSKACFASRANTAFAPLQRLSVFRFPFGTCNAESLKAVNDKGLFAIQWDVVSGDPAPNQTAEAIRKGVLAHAKPGSIVVMHGNGRGHHTAEALPLLIEDLRRKGSGFATVSELLAKGRPIVASSCYELKPGDNDRYDKLFGANDKTTSKKN